MSRENNQNILVLIRGKYLNIFVEEFISSSNIFVLTYHTMINICNTDVFQNTKRWILSNWFSYLLISISLPS